MGWRVVDWIPIVLALSAALAAVSTTALAVGVLWRLSTENENSAKTVEKPVETFRAACTVCGAERYMRRVPE